MVIQSYKDQEFYSDQFSCTKKYRKDAKERNSFRLPRYKNKIHISKILKLRQINDMFGEIFTQQKKRDAKLIFLKELKISLLIFFK